MTWLNGLEEAVTDWNSSTATVSTAITAAITMLAMNLGCGRDIALRCPRPRSADGTEVHGVSLNTPFVAPAERGRGRRSATSLPIEPQPPAGGRRRENLSLWHSWANWDRRRHTKICQIIGKKW